MWQLAGNDACDIHSWMLSLLLSLIVSENSRLSHVYASNNSRIVFETCTLFSFHQYHASIFPQDYITEISGTCEMHESGAGEISTCHVRFILLLIRNGWTYTRYVSVSCNKREFFFSFSLPFSFFLYTFVSLRPLIERIYIGSGMQNRVEVLRFVLQKAMRNTMIKRPFCPHSILYISMNKIIAYSVYKHVNLYR